MSTTSRPLRCLLVEDSEDDAHLVLRALRDGGFDVTAHRVETADAMRAALEREPWDLVLSDYQMPQFNGLAALRLLKASGLDLPFIIVSGTIGEDVAVTAMKAGAHDYLMKDKLARLGPAVQRELGEAAERRARRLAEAEVRLLSRALEQSPVSVIITDRQGHIEYVNPCFEQVTGYTRAEVIGQNPRLLKSGETPPATYAELWQAITAGGEWRGELCNRRKNGEIYWEFAAISGLANESGTVDRFIAVKENITARKQADIQRAALTEQLLQSQKMESIGLLAGGVAHDFNNMLAAITGNAELALRKCGAEHEGSRHVQAIQEAAQRAARLTGQLLSFARKQPVVTTVLDLNAVIDSIVSMLRPLLGERVRLAWAPETGLWPIAGDTAQMDQVLTNLAINARDAQRGDGLELQISTANVQLDADFVAAGTLEGTKAGAFVRLRVQDDGVGMDAPTRARIFEPFFTTKAPGKGTGLGLSTVFGIVQQHGGLVDVESTPGVGTTFSLYFPRASQPAEGATDPTEALPRGTETIVLAEDEDGVRAAATEMLQLLGYVVHAARDGGEAARLFEGDAGSAELLLTDVIMPGINGAALRDLLLAKRPDLKVLFMSGYTSDIVGVLEPGVHFVRKPFSLSVLANGVRRALDT